MIPRHLESRHLAGEDGADRQHAVLRNEDRIGDRDGLRSGPLEPAHVPAVMIDHHIADRDQAPGQRRWRSFAGKQRGEYEPGGAVDAAGPGPAAGNPVSAIDLFHLWRRRVGDGEQVVRIVPDLLLRLERKEGGHPAETNRQCPTPAGAPAGATKLEADLCKLRGAILVAAEAFGLHCPEDVRVAQRLHGFGGHSFGFFGRERSRLDLRTQLAHPAEDVGEFRPRRRLAVGDVERCFHLHDVILPDDCNDRHGFLVSRSLRAPAFFVQSGIARVTSRAGAASRSPFGAPTPQSHRAAGMCTFHRHRSADRPRRECRWT